MQKLYVEFLFPGNVVSDISEKEVGSRKEAIKLPKGAYGYRFFEREETGPDDDITYGAKKNHSGVIYYGAEITLTQLKKEMPGKHAFISMMEKNGYKRAVKTILGQLFPLANSDSVKNVPKKQ
jgi:hypothetical protein